MTHLEELFDKYCTKHELCDDCKYYKDKRITNGKSCNEAYAEDYHKRHGNKTKLTIEEMIYLRNEVNK